MNLYFYCTRLSRIRLLIDDQDLLNISLTTLVNVQSIFFSIILDWVHIVELYTNTVSNVNSAVNRAVYY